MKKTFFGLLALCAMFAFSSCKDKAATANGETTEASASEQTGLEGTWVADAKAMMASTDKSLEESCEKAELIMSLDGKNLTMSFDILCNVTEKDMNLVMGIKADFDGPYTSTDNTITADYKEVVPKVDLYKFEMNLDAETKAMMEAVGMTEDAMKEEFTKNMTPENMKDMAKSFNATINYQMPDSKTLILTDEKGEKVTFTRK